jgi:hypothetical protein
MRWVVRDGGNVWSVRRLYDAHYYDTRQAATPAPRTEHAARERGGGALGFPRHTANLLPRSAIPKARTNFIGFRMPHTNTKFPFRLT